MSGSTDHTEGTASAVPSVASAQGPPLTRREARALREAQEKAAKRGGVSGKKPQEAAPEAVVPAATVADEASAETAPEPTPATVAVPVNPAAVEVSAQPVQDQPKTSRAGRNLPAAIAVGAVLLGVVLGGLFWFEPLLVFLVVVLSGIGCWEVARATTHAKTSVPMLPLFVASALMPISAVWGGLEALGFSYLICLLITLIFRLMEGLKGAAASVMSSVFIISWIPLLLSFALLILDEPRGQWMIAIILLLAVSNDTFGYIVGVLFGKHPMAPKISPKKSWEGFAGSMLGSMLVGALAMYFWMDMPWWTGVILAFFTTIAATTGDFSESMVKRELGIKDMSNLLPGHGGIMDRLDSILFVIPLGYLISHLLSWSLSLG